MTERLTYEELDKIIIEYQAGSSDAADRLIKAFEGFLVRYVDIIHWGKYQLNERNVRQFVGLYLKDPEKRKHIHQYTRMVSIRAELYRVIDNLKEMFTPFSLDEIWNELVCALLALAKRYRVKPDMPRFHSYVQKVYHYQVRRQLASLLIDPAAYRFEKQTTYIEDTMTNEPYGDSSIVDFASVRSKEDSERRTLLLEDEFEDEIGDNWINGYTAGEAFRALSKLERRIIKLYYEDNKSDQKIAEITGACRATINRRRLVAKRKIENAIRKSNAL